MHEYELKLLSLLKEKNSAGLDYLEKNLGMGRDAIMWAAESLMGKNAVSIERVISKNVELSAEGKTDLEGFPEEALIGELYKAGGHGKVSGIKNQVSLSWAKRNGWISIDKGEVRLTGAGKDVAAGKGSYGLRELLVGLSSGKGGQNLLSRDKEGVETLIRRGLVEVKERSMVKSVSITEAGREMLEALGGGNEIGALSKEIIKSGSWKSAGFRPYDINAEVDRTFPARLHPVREFINFVRHKWLEMGFIEVSGPIVESSFWNFDALFSPQDHPTREMQDTFFLSNPREISIEDLEALERVRKMHTAGWKEVWMEGLAKQAVLRTHTTSVSAHFIRKLSNTLNENYPLRLFSVGSVFRNESIDYKHLAELHQYDGIIIGNNLTLANLIDTLKKFYGKLGFDNVKLRPSYFPFTEPSLEAFYYDEEHGDTIELTGGGIIRKEITKAMGTDRTVLAWGGGIERLMINSMVFGLDSIQTPYKNNLGWLRARKNLKV